MAKAIGPLMSVSASGKFADTLVFQKNGVVRNYVIPANPNTTDQQTQRNKLKDIQAELKLLGAVLRAELKTQFGARWNSDIIGDLLANDGAALTAYDAEWDAFGGTDQADWATADGATAVAETDGRLLYSVASAIYDRGVRLGATLTLTQPSATNSSAVGSEWTANT